MLPPPHSGRRAPARGFTLIELMVTVAVAAVLLALAAPAMRNVLTQRATVADASELVEAMRFARSEAIKRSGPVSICKVATAGATTCDTGGSTWQYWLVFAERPPGASNTNCVVDAGESSLRKHSEAAGRVKWQAASPANFGCVTFQSTGIAIADHWSATTSGGAKSLWVTALPNMSASDPNVIKRSGRKVCLNAQGRVDFVDGLTNCP